MQCITRTLKTVQKLTAERYPLHNLNKHRISDVAEAISQTSQLSKWRQGFTARGLLALLAMSPRCTIASYTCCALITTFYVYCCQIVV